MWSSGVLLPALTSDSNACRAPWPCTVHAAVAALLLWGAAPAATVQAQDGTPSAPRKLAAEPGNAMVTLTWSPPANDGGSDITGYEYQVDQGDWNDAGAADARSVVVSGLENLRQYTFSLRALNGGTEPGAAATVQATPRAAITAPSAPQNLTAEPGDTVVRIFWEPPADNGGSALTRYEFRGGLVTSWLPAPPTENGPANFASLENGREYTFEVRAVNDVDPGAVATVEATPRAEVTAPSAPRNLAASPGDAQMTLTRSPPANDGGSDITGYEYHVDQGDWNDAGAADARSVVVSGLENLRQYTFSLRALNGGTEPGAAATVQATPRAAITAPTAPRNLTAEPGDTVVRITWEPPADNGGSALTGYQMRGGLQTTWVSIPATETGPAIFPNLENGREYTFEVRAVNDIGPGPIASVNATPRAAPSAPRNLTVSPRDTTATLTWGPPAEDGGSAITGYQYQVDQGD